jgi:hypothetical protein
LYVLGEYKWPGIQYKNSMTARFVREEQMLSEDWTETTASDHNDVKRAGIVLWTSIRALPVRVRARESFVHPITDVTAQNVTCEICFLRFLSSHLTPPEENSGPSAPPN